MATTLGLDPTLLEIIVCPKCHGKLEPREIAGAEPGTGELACLGECGLVYPVRDGIPVLLVDEARN
ncbi:Trm112 family protein [Nocardioides sp. Iso805N]|uniref:Trm112 family protein n=1 Tax=Nocardioides sp. Iso805N TaxID=1283287 RepID=UPI00036B77A8|nr:Trm112 family protein [Nocardioides sp. Iso805N]